MFYEDALAPVRLFERLLFKRRSDLALSIFVGRFKPRW
jgi:hypothetical protein